MSLATRKSIVCGDFNLNMFNPYKLASIDQYIGGFVGAGFFPVITRPTRICVTNPTTKFSLIDQIWSNFILDSNPTSGVIDLSLSDHLLCYLFLKGIVGVRDDSADNRMQVRPLPAICIDNWVTYISCLNFNIFLDSNLSCTSLSTFLSLLYNAYDIFFPVKFKPCLSRGKDSPWITRDIILLTRKKYRLLKLLQEELFQSEISACLGIC